MKRSSLAEMDPGRWEHVERILDQVLDLPPEQRGQFMDAACGEDRQLRAEVEWLLSADAEAGTFLEEPAAVAAASLLSGSPSFDGEAPFDRTGQRIGPYHVVRQIGSGGMGSVYLAERADGEFEQQVALKLIRAGWESAEIVRRFLAERQILARLEHPGIARLLDGGATPEGQPWFALEYVEGGEPITRWCDERRLDVEARLKVFEDVCRAVAYAHRHLVVHRDLKPSNMLVGRDGAVKLLDFGIAKLLEPGPEAAATRALTGLWIMTPEYGAPEQVRGDPVTTATDVYSLGAVLYELLTGHRAHRFGRLTPLEVQRVVCDEDVPLPSGAVTEPASQRSTAGDAPPPTAEELAARRSTTPRKLSRHLAGDLDTLLGQALHKDAGRRYPSADALLDDLRRYRAGLPLEAKADSAVYRLGKFVRRHRMGVGAAALVFVAVASGTAGVVWQARAAVRQAARARAVTDFLTELFEVSSPEESRGRDITARELLERGVARVDSGLAGEPALQAELYGVLGTIHRDLGLVDRSERLLRRAVDLASSTHGAEAPEVAAPLTDLGSVLNAQGRFAEAETTLVRALELRRRALRPDDPLVAMTLNELAATQKNLGRYEEAEALYREMIAIDRTRYGAGSLEVAKDLNNLGVLLDDVGRYEAADSAYRRALALRRAALDPGHPDLLVSLGNLASVLGDLGEYDEQARLRVEQLQGLRAIFPDGHPEVAYALHGLALARADQGRLGEADSLYAEALAMRERWLGIDHPLTAATRNNLAIVRFRMARFDEAAETMRGVLATWERTHGPDHRNTITARNNLGAILTEAGRYEEAEPLLVETLERRRRVFGPDHVQVALVARNLGILLHRTGRHEDARALLEEAVQIYRATFEEPHPRTAEALTALGALLVDDGRADDAVPALREALEIRIARLGERHFRTAETRRELGKALAAVGLSSEAETLLVQSWDVLSKDPFLEHEAFRTARALVEFYEARGRPGEADRYR